MIAAELRREVGQQVDTCGHHVTTAFAGMCVPLFWNRCHRGDVCHRVYSLFQVGVLLTEQFCTYHKHFLRLQNKQNDSCAAKLRLTFPKGLTVTRLQRAKGLLDVSCRNRGALHSYRNQNTFWVTINLASAFLQSGLPKSPPKGGRELGNYAPAMSCLTTIKLFSILISTD